MMNEMQKLMQDYHNWLRDKTQIKQVHNEWVEITTPHLDRHNDYLQIYIKKNGDEYILTDDSYILDDLEMSGAGIAGAKRQNILNTVLAGFGVQREENQLIVKTDKNNFAFKKHSLLQAMLAVDDMFYLSRQNVFSLFYEDVVSWLELLKIRYIPKVSFVGKSGYTNMFDFVIPKSPKAPERLLQTINYPRKDVVEALLFRWEDIQKTRSESSQLIAVLNDVEREVPRDAMQAINNYNIMAMPWSQKNVWEEKLAA